MRSAFLAAADAARPLLDHRDLAGHWGDPSPLAEMSIAQLCGHLTRAVTVVPTYLDTEGNAAAVDAPGYFLAIDGIRAPDLAGDRAKAIRARGGAAATGGVAAVKERWDAARAVLGTSLRDEDGSRLIAVMGSTMAVDDYLVTRMVELVVHADDLAVALQAETPEFDPAATDPVMACLWEMARRRSRPLDIIRAMTRVERDAIEALRVL